MDNVLAGSLPTVCLLIFGSHDQDRKRALFRHFFENIPNAVTNTRTGFIRFNSVAVLILQVVL